MGVDPISMLLIGATAGLKAIGSISGGYAAQAEANYQAQVADYNKKIASQVGSIEAENSMMKTRAKAGAIKSGFAASGVDVNTGSAADVGARTKS